MTPGLCVEIAFCDQRIDDFHLEFSQRQTAKPFIAYGIVKVICGANVRDSLRRFIFRFPAKGSRLNWFRFWNFKPLRHLFLILVDLPSTF
jgi:hypothetical protein